MRPFTSPSTVSESTTCARWYRRARQPAASGSGALLTQANAEGQSGYFYVGPMIFFPNGYGQPGVARNVYGKPTHCSGTVMCRSGSPL